MAYIFKYSPRPTTAADSSKQMAVPEIVKEERNQRLLSLLTAFSTAYNETFIGTKQEVLTEGFAPHGGKLFGRNRYNKKVIFDGSSSLIGSFREIFVEKATSSALEGRRHQ